MMKKKVGFSTIIIYILLILLAVVTIVPFIQVFTISMSPPEVASSYGLHLIPTKFDFSGYRSILKHRNLWVSYKNTIVRTFLGTILSMFLYIIGAYPLSKKYLPHRKFWTMIIVFTMYFSGGMIPAFLLITKLGLYGHPLSQIIPACFSIWNIILVKAYLSSIPEGLREAAKIDGAGVFRILVDVYLPLSKPILAVLAVYTIVAVWNNWFSALIYLPKTDWQPLQLYLRRVLVEDTKQIQEVMGPEMAQEMVRKQMSGAQMKYAMIIFTTLPVLFAYPFFQKYFVKGVMLGSLKE